MKNAVVHKDSAPHSVWGNGCHSWVLANTPALSVKQEAMQPGTKETLHFHCVAQQFFFVLKGEACFYMEDEIHLMKEGQGLLVPAGAKHFVAAGGNGPLSFLVISQPATEGDRTNIGTKQFV